MYKTKVRKNKGNSRGIITTGPMFKAIVVKALPHLAPGYTNGQYVACWRQTNTELPEDDERHTIWRVCRPDGRADRMLSTEQIRESLKACRDKNNEIIHYCDAEYTRIADAHWFDLTR